MLTGVSQKPSHNHCLKTEGLSWRSETPLPQIIVKITSSNSKIYSWRARNDLFSEDALFFTARCPLCPGREADLSSIFQAGHWKMQRER